MVRLRKRGPGSRLEEDEGILTLGCFAKRLALGKYSPLPAERTLKNFLKGIYCAFMWNLLDCMPEDYFHRKREKVLNRKLERI